MFFETKRVQNVNEVTNTVEEVINGKPFTSNETRTNTRVNAVEKLREDVDNLTEDYNRNKETQDKFNETVSENLTVIRKQIADNKAKQDKKDVEQDAQIRENTLIVRTIDRRFKEVHTRIDKVEDVLADHTSQLSVIRKQVSENTTKLNKHEERLNEIDKKLDEGFSTLTIYVPEVTTDTQAFEYAINRGIAPRSIKSIDLNSENQYVVTYNTSETGITGSRQAFLREKNIEAFREGHKPKEEPNIGEITFYNKNSEDEVRSELSRYGYAGEHIVDISLRGKDYVAKVDLGKAGDRVEIPTVGENTRGHESSHVGEKVDVPAKESNGAGTRVILPASENSDIGNKVDLPNAATSGAGSEVDLPST